MHISLISNNGAVKNIARKLTSALQLLWKMTCKTSTGAEGRCKPHGGAAQALRIFTSLVKHKRKTKKEEIKPILCSPLRSLNESPKAASQPFRPGFGSLAFQSQRLSDIEEV